MQSVSSAETVFGQSVLDHPQLTIVGQWANPFWTNPFWANPFLDLVCVMASKGGAQTQKNRAPEWWGPEGWGARNFALFLPSPTPFSLFLSFSGGSSRGFLVVFERLGPSNVHVWSSRVVLRSPGSPEAAGVSHEAREPNPALQKHHQNSTRRPRERKNAISGGREKKEREILGGPGDGRSGGGGVRERGPKILNTLTTHTQHTHTHSTNKHQQAPTGTNRHQQAPTGTNT